ncbi:MAG: glycosyltransferase family 2 protein [Patescibacteria group bacterium]|nr:glycosyltransferase family 2 protein [Patescibacteria group bacterium]
MKISVIIATYNDPQLKKCLDSLYASQDADFEVIVIDDGSTTVDVEQVVNNYSAYYCLKLEKNTGPSISRNFGAKQAKGKILFFLDSDAQVYPDTLIKIQRRFEKEPKLQGLSIIWSDEPIKDTFFNKFKAIEMNYNFKHLFNCSWGSNGSAIYKDIFLAEGGFDEKFRKVYGEDFFLGLKLFGKGYNISLDKNILMKHCFYEKYFLGLKKYSMRAFLRARELASVKNKLETSYNSKRFQALYLLSIFTIFFGILGLFLSIPLLCLVAIGLYLIFFNLVLKLYVAFYKKYGLTFFIKAVITHYFYILSISISGILGFLIGKMFKKKSYEF